MKRILTATCPDGTKITRQTERDYKFVVISRTSGIEGKTRPGWGHIQWSSRRDLAEKTANQYRPLIGKDDGYHGVWLEILIIPVDSAAE
jgi:hypothetical protein